MQEGGKRVKVLTERELHQGKSKKRKWQLDESSS